MRLFNLLASLLLVVTFGACNQNKDRVSDSKEVKQSVNNEWVAITGTVIKTGPNAFTLDYGKGLIQVEMDDWDWFPEGRQLMRNDPVIVYGYIDDDLFERRTIEASSVYVQDLGTQFYASGLDEEDFRSVTVYDFTPRIELVGRVKKVGEGKFELDYGAGKVAVATKRMPYDPLDDEGFQQIQSGDKVRVSGKLDYDLFNDKDLMADSIVTLKDASKS